ncbi:MAG: amino acid adenylation domain-containing protein [Clostridia bacterium]|nr:amino acid adenylation domain-containing protein [Clostridia bacterium]
MEKKSYKLTFPQNNIWLIDRIYQDTAINMITGIINLEKDFNIDFCKRAVNDIIRENDAMRINIKMEGSKVLQIVREYHYDDIELVDMTLASSEEIEKYIQKIAETKIDIFNEKLYEFQILKYSENRGGVLLRIHHIISDAWSFSKIIEQFTKHYSNIKENITQENEMPSYLQFLETQNEYIKSERYLKDREYFKEYLKDIEYTATLKDRGSQLSNQSKRYNVKLDRKLNDTLLRFCKENKISPFVLFLTILSVYTYRIRNMKDIVIGTPVLNRANFKEKQTLGVFITTLPIRIKILENMKVIELAKNVASNTMSAFRHQRFPYDHILKDLREESAQKSNLYSMILSYQNARANYEEKDEYSTKWYCNHSQVEDLQMHILDMDSTGVLEINYDYLIDIFSEDEIVHLHTRLIQMIDHLITDENVTVDHISIMSKSEKRILKEFNHTKRIYPKNKAVIDLFEEQAKRTPENIALIFENRKYTYQELNEASNVIANYLLKIGVKPNDIVSIIMKRSDKLVILLLAILKCRAAYLPVDSTYPRDRIEYILKNSDSVLVIKDRDFKDDIEGMNLIDIPFEELIYAPNDKNKENLNIKFHKDAINYLMYTSGSTGNPKGVAVSVGNLVNFVYGINDIINMNSTDKVVSITTVSFDIFGLELWVTLVFGATIVLANDSECIDGNKLSKLCLKYGVTIIQTTPTKLKMLLNTTEYIHHMKKILLGGEKVPKEFIDRLKSLTDATIYDVYGPTETTIWSTIQDVTNCTKISVGKPIANTKIYILDEKNRILPIGICGQVAIAGDGVSIGYYNNKMATEKNYIYSDVLKEEIYLTGDLGKLNFDSTLSILDRIDLQVKLNGQRIELEDIEKNITSYNGIKETVVVLKENRILVCYYIKKDRDVKINENEIIRFLYTKLPSYMIPSVYKELDEFPLTLNGKTDRKALAKIDVKIENSVLYEKPETPLQKKIHSIWSKTLGRDDFGINDRFFEMGADSLAAIKTQIDLLSLGIHLEYKDLLKYQSIKELEKYIIKNKKEIHNTNIDKYEDFSRILNKNKMAITKIEKSNIRNILLTGVTGFLGIHILDSFMKEKLGKVYCIIRGKNKKAAKERFIDTLHYYFGNQYDHEIGNRIIPIDGNFIEENIGLKDNIYHSVVSDVDLVIHSAACVKHYGDANYFKKVNIDGTKNIAKFCYENHIKMIHISTISVSGNSFEIMNSNQSKEHIADFDETCFYQNQNLDNIYVYTKFKAEEEVLKYIQRGLHANILRIGNLTNRYEDLKFQYNVEENAFANKLKTFISIGAFPESNRHIYLEFTPVDLCANAIIKIAEYFNIEHNVFHLYDHHHVYINEFAQILKELNINIDIIKDEEFAVLIDKIAQSDNNQILNGIINDLSEKNRLNYESSVKVHSEHTQDYLRKIGFLWPKIDEKYIIGYVDYLRKIGFLNK